MYLFNAFQITVLFSAYPFLVQWVSDAQFKGAKAAFWAIIVAYVVHFGFCVAAWYEFLGKHK